MTTVERLGYTVLASGGSDSDQLPVANIVFVHGLRGHPKKTWEYADKKKANPFTKWLKRPTSEDDSVFWPADLLPNTVKRAKIMTFGYNADIFGSPLQGASKTTITQHGRDLMVQLERIVGNTEPVIFVVHSLGGIVLKEGLHWAKTRLEEKYQALYKRVKHVIFLGTPHRGSKMAPWGGFVANFAAIALQDGNKVLSKSLSVDNEILDQIHDSFALMLHSNDFTVHSFQEGRGMSGIKGFSDKVVNDVSSKLGHPLEVVERIDANFVDMARFASANDDGYRKISGVLEGYVAQLERDRASDSASVEGQGDYGKKGNFNVDQLPSRFFTGRAQELKFLSDQLIPADRTTAQRRVVVWGCGGAGKSQLVTQWVCTHAQFFSDVFWITARSAINLKETFADIARQIGLPERIESAPEDAASQKRAIDAVKRWFAEHDPGDWLLVVDNADELDAIDVEAFIPQTLKGNVIITSRNRQAQGFGPAIELGELSAGDAQSLLLKRSGIGTPSADEEKTAAAIVESLGYLALAIEHAGAYVQSVDGSLEEYLREYKSNRRSLLSEAHGVSKDNQSVFATFDLSFRAVAKRNLAAARLLTFTSFLDYRCIQETLILNEDPILSPWMAQIFQDGGGYMKARRDLLAFSLIRMRTSDGINIISVHPLVHYFSRARLSPKRLTFWTDFVSSYLIRSTTNGIASTQIFIQTMRFCEQATAAVMEDSKTVNGRKTFWCLIVELMLQYQLHWKIHGANGERDRYCKMAIDALEGGIEEIELLCRSSAVYMRMESSEYVAGAEPGHVMQQRFLLEQMTAGARAAVSEAEALDQTPSGSQPTALVERKEAFSPTVLTDVFVNVPSVVYGQQLCQHLSMAVTSHAGRKCWHQASLFSRLAGLPLTAKDRDGPEEMDVTRLIISAARDDESGNFAQVCDRYNAIVRISYVASSSLDRNVLFHSSMLFVSAFDYSKFLLKLKRPIEAEIIARRYLAPEESQEEAAKRIEGSLVVRASYCWAQKVVAYAQIQQGRLEEGRDTLLNAEALLTKLMGAENLSVFHIWFLLQQLHLNPDFAPFGVEDRSAEIKKSFTALYGGSTAKLETSEGLNMGTILMAQGALDEAIYVLELFAKLALEALGEEHAVTRKAERLSAVARRERLEELELERSWQEGDSLRLMKYGCTTVPRDVNNLGKD
ncbi:MAG: hypothetical protein M1825_003511 [Sarcosagium campestre]|nr:MAG: hypothetical protein M1825_003511 [Sarcosagium campestre]